MTRASRGLTLFEVLVSAALLFLCITIAVTAFMAGSRNFAKSKEAIDAQEGCRKILEMISSEVREADPSTLVLGAGGVSIRFSKYHRPSNSTHDVTWKYNATSQNVERRYTENPGGGTYATSFGERVSRLIFTKTVKGGGSSSAKIGVAITAMGQIEVAGETARQIVNLSTEIYLRPRQSSAVNVTVDRGGGSGSSSGGGEGPPDD